MIKFCPWCRIIFLLIKHLFYSFYICLAIFSINPINHFRFWTFDKSIIQSNWNFTLIFLYQWIERHYIVISNIIITINKSNEFTSCYINRHITSITQSSILFVYNLYTLILFCIFVTDSSTAIRTTIIDKNYFKISICLR